MRRAFVSHSTSDDSYVGEMESFLRAAGFDEVFNDVSAIRPDEKFWPAIEKGIANADTLVVVITAASNASDWVKREVEYARSLSRKIIPVWIEDCPVPSTFADRDVIDFRPRTREARRSDISRIVKYAPAELIGREDETKLLHEAWEKVLRIERGRPHVLTFVALGGEGKTSLIAKWAAELAGEDWPGCDAAFAWSFYSQGTREQVAASSDLFLKEALTFFGNDEDKDFAASPAGAFEKGQRLARIVGRRRSLLILDGLEPLQSAPTSPTPGQLKDQGVAALLKGLAAASHGLCVVTTRYSLPDLRAFWQTAAPEVKLLRLSRAAGVHLLQSFGVKGSLLRNLPLYREHVNEFEKLVEDVQGHALTLNLLGTYLRDAHAGDIRKRGLVKLEEADAEEQGGHAFRVMEAYEREFEREGEKGQRALAVLRLLGLFDRPLTSDCLGALLQAPAIAGLTKPFFTVEIKWLGIKRDFHPIPKSQLTIAFKRLENARLLTVNSDAASLHSASLNLPTSLDTHPLLREYFAQQLRAQQPDAWRAAHRRLYEHLCARTQEGDEPTLEDLQPLYQAVAHGCQAGKQREANEKLYYARIHRRDENYSSRILSASGSELEAVACFFETPWSRVSPALTQSAQGWFLHEAAFHLRALGRLSEAIEPARASVSVAKRKKDKINIVIYSSTLSELELAVGDIVNAVRHSKESCFLSPDTDDMFLMMATLTTWADALHQAGRIKKAGEVFAGAEEAQALRQPRYPILASVAGFRYCNFLLAHAERIAWQVTAGVNSVSERRIEPPPRSSDECKSVLRRTTQTLEWSCRLLGPLDIALDHLTLGRATFYGTLLTESKCLIPRSRLTVASGHLEAAVDGLRVANQQWFTPQGFLTRAWLRFLTGARIGPESAQADLDEAWEIAERGPMKLYLADIHLHRARLFFREAQYPWESPQDDLAAAEKLINDCGYHRRDEELADAKAAILSR